MAAERSFAIEILGIAHVEGVEGAGQGILGPGDADEMDVVGHKAVGPDVYSVSRLVFPQPIDIAAIIGLGLEDGLVVVPPLDDVVGVTDDGGAGETGHRVGYRRWAPRGAEAAQKRLYIYCQRLIKGGRQAPRSIQKARTGMGIDQGSFRWRQAAS